MDAPAITAAAAALGWVASEQPFPRTGGLPDGPDPDPAFDVAHDFERIKFKTRAVLESAHEGDWPRDDLPMPYDQGDDANTCVAHAACASIEMRLERAGIVAPALAPRFLHLCLVGLPPLNGARPSRVAKVLIESGVPEDTGGDADLVRNDECPLEPPPTIRIAGWKPLGGDAEVKAALVARGPVVAHMQLHADFWDHYGDGVYRPTGVATNKTHAVCVIGYDDAAGYWVCRNSRGPQWGRDGYFLIAHGACGLATTLPAYEFLVV